MTRHVYLQLTDIKFHTQEVRKPNPLLRVASKILRSGKAKGRAFGNRSSLQVSEDGRFRIQLPLGKFATKPGEDVVVHLLAPKGGLPVFLGEDAVNRLQSWERKATERL